MNTQNSITSYERLKAERQKALQKKEDTIVDILNSAKKNPKFIRLLVYSLNSLEAMVTPPNREIRDNSKIIIKKDGITIVHSIAMLNTSHEEIIDQIGRILYKILSYNDLIDQELSQLFAEKNGHEAIIEILLSKSQGYGSIHYIKILNILCSIPQLIDKLIDSGLIESIKLVNDLYSDDINIININFDTMKKITNQKKGRDYLIDKGLIPNILKNISNCSGKNNPKSVINGFYVLDNLSRNENGKEAIRDANAMLILSEILDNFCNDEKVLKKGAKIINRISNEEAMKKEIEKIKNCHEKIQNDCSFSNLEELRESLSLISNLMLVEDFVKIAFEEEHFKMLIELFNLICSIDLNGKDEDFNNIYMILVKNFMVIFKRIFTIFPECYNEESDKGKLCINLFKNIYSSIRKNFESVKNTVEKLEENKDPKGMKVQIQNVFKSYFFSYTDLLVQNYNHKKENEKENSNWIELLEYLIENVISNGKKFFDVEQKSNFGASQILKISDETIQKFPNPSQNLSILILNTFDYLKSILNSSEHFKTLSNDLKVLLNMIKRKDDENSKKIKEELIPIILNFMNKKPKFRYPNYINLKILDIYLTQDFINGLMNNPDPKINPNYSLNFIDAINSVMIKAFYESSTVLKVLGTNEEEKHENEEKEEYNENLEIKITNKGCDLLKKLISDESYLKKVKKFKHHASTFKINQSKVEEILSLENDLFYQICSLNIKQFYDIGSSEVLNTLKDLLKKEISTIESFKRIKSNETNPKYHEICDSSNKRLKIELALLKKIEDGSIIFYNEMNDDKYIENIKNVIKTNIDFIEKSTDNENLIGLLIQIRKNIPFLKENEEILKNENNEGVIEQYIDSLMKLFSKSLENQSLCNEIIKTFIQFTNKKPEICNLLVRNGCPRLLLQIMENYPNKNTAIDSLELLRMITLSNEENLNIVSKQNILSKLFEIRAKFANDENITKSTDLIANEIMKLPGQEEFASDIIKQQIKEFYENLKGDFSNSEIKHKILNNLETINAFSSNKKQISLLFADEFQSNLNKVIDLTKNEKEISQVIEKLLTNEMSILKKIKENIPSKDNNKHNDIIENTIKIIKNKSNYLDTLLLSCRILSDYIKDEDLFNKYLNEKIDDDFIDKLFEINENYIDNAEVTKEINNLLCYLSLRNPKFAEHIVSKGGLSNVLEQLKESVNLNDENSKLLKLNGLKMLSTLLNNDNNMDIFVKSKGIDLINNFVKNELKIYGKDFDDENENEDNLFKTKETINLSDIKDDIKEDNDSEKNENKYFVHCLKIINQGINKGRKDFIDEKTIQNIITLTDISYPEIFFFNEVTNILTNENVNLTHKNNEDNNISLMKLIYDYNSRFYFSNNVRNKVKEIEERLKMFAENEKLKTKFKNSFNQNNSNSNNSIDEINKKVTYLSFLCESNGINNLINESKDEILSFYNNAFTIYKNDNKNIKEGIIISLMKLTNYLFENKLIEKEQLSMNIKNLIQFSEIYYKPENYNFVNEYNNEMEKLLEKNGKFKNEESEKNYNLSPNENYDNIDFSEENLNNMKMTVKNLIIFYEDYLKGKKKNQEKEPLIIKRKRDENLNKILLNTNDYYRTNEDKDEKNNYNNKVFEICCNLLNELETDSKENKDENEISYNTIIERTTKLLSSIQNILNKDYSNSIIDFNNNGRVKELIDKINNLIKSNQINEPFLRNILKMISSKIENGNDDLLERFLNFVPEDTVNNKEVSEIKNINLQTISNLSKFQSSIKTIMKNESLFNLIKEEYSKEDLPIESRQSLSLIFNNISKSNYNIENLIDSDPNSIKLIFIKVLSHTITSKEENGINVAKTEISTVANVIKDNNNLKNLLNKNIILEEDISKLGSIYDSIDPEISSEIKEIIQIIEELNKNKAEETAIINDEALIEKIEKIIEEPFNIHLEEFNKLNKEKEKEDLNENIIDENIENDVIKSSSNISKNNLNEISKILIYHSLINNNVKSILSIKENDQMLLTLEQMLNIIRSNFNEIKNNNDINIIQRRIIIVNKFLEMINKVSLSVDNHKMILEGGLISFCEKILEESSNDDLEKISKDEKLSYLLSFSKNSKEIIQNCSQSENSIPIIIESPIFNSIIEEVLMLYEKPEILSSNEEIRRIFLYDNIIFSTICRNKKGTEKVFEKIGGMEKLIDLGKKTGNEHLLETIFIILINYIKNSPNLDEIKEDFWNDIFILINICFDLKNKTSSLISKVYELISLIYIPKLKSKIEQMKIIDKINNDLMKYKNSIDFLNNIINCLKIICDNNAENIQETVKSGLITKIKDIISMNKLDENIAIVYNLSKLYYFLLFHNLDNIEDFCKNGITEDILLHLKTFNIQLENKNENEKEESKIKEIMKNSIDSLDQITVSQKANLYLSKKNFDEIIIKTLKYENNDIDYISISLHTLGNYHYTKIGDNNHKLNYDELAQLLQTFQKKYYSNSDILTNINYIAGNLIKNISDKNNIKKYFNLLSESIKIQDWNENLIMMALKLIYEGLIKHLFLIDEVYEDTSPNIFNLLKIYKDNYQIQVLCYKILNCFSKNSIFSYLMVNSGLIEITKKSIENPNYNNNKNTKIQIRNSIFDLLISLSNEEQNSKKISDELMMELLKILDEEGYNEDLNSKNIIHLLLNLLHHKYCIQPFIQYKGLETSIDLLKENELNTDLILNVFKMLSMIAKSNEEYKIMMQNLKLPDLINIIIKKCGIYDKKIEFEGRSLIFLINNAKVKLEKVDDIDYEDIKVVNPIKPEIKNFLTSGKQLKIINSKGDIKQMQLMFSQDLLKISAKKIKSNLPPKPKYIIETKQIKQIIKGHGTDAFKKSKGFFRSIPKPEVCFSIIGPTTVEGVKAINVQCENSKDADKWINYIEIVINYFKRTQAIKSTVLIKK